MPTVQGTDAFDHGFDVPADYDAVFGTPTAVSSPLYQSRLNTLEINGAGANEGVRKNYTDSPTMPWVGAAIRRDAAPTAGGLLAFEIRTVGGERAQIRWAGTGGIIAALGADSSVVFSASVSTFYWIEMIFDVSGTAHTAYWQVNGADQDPVASNPGSSSSGDYTQILSEATDSGLTWYAGGYWAWGAAASTSDWLGEPTAVRTYKRLYGPAQLTGSAADLYTCPASTITRTLHIHASNPSGSAVDANLSIGTDAAGTRVWDDLAIPADGMVDVFDPYELAAGEKIQGWAASAGTVVVSITGYEDPV